MLRRISSFATSFWQTQLYSRHSKVWYSRLTPDIFVDIIFPLLDVLDIIRLGQVNKWFYNLVRHRVIWKRRLRTMKLPVHPLPPTSCHSFEKLTPLDAERLVVRAYSLDRAWKRKVPSCDRWRFNACYHVKHMVLVPGSRYLVASVCDIHGGNWALAIYYMDGPFGVVPIARYGVPTKAFHLQARYLDCEGRPGLVIAYVSRKWRHKGGRESIGLDISGYSGEHEVEIPYPVLYECKALHVSLRNLEGLCNSGLVPGSEGFLEYVRNMASPFTEIAFARSAQPLGPLSLDDIAGAPYLSWVQANGDNVNKILFKPLFYNKENEECQAPLTTMVLSNYDEYPNARHRIKAFRLLPQQMDVLVVREVQVSHQENQENQLPMTMIELHPIRLPRATYDSGTSFDERICLKNSPKSTVHITDHGTPPWVDQSVAATLRGPYDFRPNPVSIYFVGIKPEPGIARYTLFPDPPAMMDAAIDPADPRFEQYNHTYRLDRLPRIPSWIPAPPGTHLRAIPGSYRTLFYTVPDNTRSEAASVKRIYRYFNRAVLAWQTELCEPHEEEEKEIELLIDDETENQDQDNDKQSSVKSLSYELDPSARFGPFAWDDTTGRLCFAEEGSSQIRVWDFSKTPREDVYRRRLPLPVIWEHDQIAYQLREEYESLDDITEYF